MRYRRLLRVYPAAHRAAYEEEMVGVLMADSPPGRRFPSPAAALDLLRAGLTVRLTQGSPSRVRAQWRDAAGVVGLLFAFVLAGAAAIRLYDGLRLMLFFGEPMRARGVDGLLLLDVALRTAGWTPVVIAGLLGRRRLVAWLAPVAVLLEIAARASWNPAFWLNQVLYPSTFVLAGAVAAAAFILAVPGRPPREVLGRRGMWALAAAVVSLPVIQTLLEIRYVVMGGWWLPGRDVVPFAVLAVFVALRARERFAGRRGGHVKVHE